MPGKKSSEQGALDWFGATVVIGPADGVHENEVYAEIDPFPSPIGKIFVKTHHKPGEGRIGELVARHILFQEAVKFSPPDDQDLWQKRLDLAYHELKVERFSGNAERMTDDPVQHDHWRKKAAMAVVLANQARDALA